MYHRNFVAIAFAAAVLAAPVAAWACSAAEPNTHVGTLMAVDTDGKSFTILDMQTRGPITFLSDEAVLQRLKNVRGLIQVKFKDDGNALRAVEILY